MPRSLKRIKKLSLGQGMVALTSTLAVLGMALISCNVYNPSGSGAAGETVDEKMVAGENSFRSQDYGGALSSFSAAIDQDSTNSMAYYGFAKAAMRKYNVNASTLLSEVSKAQTGEGVPFIGAADDVITNYLQATSRARKALGELTLRDTLTRWYYYTLDSTSLTAKKDKLFAKRVAFIKDYWTKAELAGARGYHRKSQFPLSDLKMGYDKVIADFGFIEMIYAITHLRDLNADNVIDSNDNLLNNLHFSAIGSGGFKVDSLQNIAKEIANDTVKRNQVNALIQNVGSGLGSASKVLDLLAPTIAGNVLGGSDTSGINAGLTEKVTKNMDSVISNLGNAIAFYQFGDGKDNDGDGCIDEEILDGKDNDGDGFIDEDARINTTAPYFDQVDNDHNGKGNEKLDPISVTTHLVADPDPDEAISKTNAPNLLYTLKSNWITGPKYKDKTTRITTQADSLTTKTPSELAGFYKEKLDAAKANIGGCWNNY